MKIYTIGFTKKMAERFFGLLWESGAEWLVAEHLQGHWDEVEIKHLRGGRFALHSNSQARFEEHPTLARKAPSQASETEKSIFPRGKILSLLKASFNMDGNSILIKHRL